MNNTVGKCWHISISQSTGTKFLILIVPLVVDNARFIKELGNILSYSICWHKVVCIFPKWPFDVCRICSDIASLIFEIDYLCLLFFLIHIYIVVVY